MGSSLLSAPPSCKTAIHLGHRAHTQLIYCSVVQLLSSVDIEADHECQAILTTKDDGEKVYWDWDTEAEV